MPLRFRIGSPELATLPDNRHEDLRFINLMGHTLLQKEPNQRRISVFAAPLPLGASKRVTYSMTGTLHHMQGFLQ